jgi:hypothetical protein
MQAIEFHELCKIVPEMSKAEFDELVEDIGKNGQHDPIVMFDRKVLDGRSRYQACQKRGIEPKFENYVGSDPRGFVLSKNVHRRHLNGEQKRDLIKKVAAAYPELSDRSIAKTVRRAPRPSARSARSRQRVSKLDRLKGTGSAATAVISPPGVRGGPSLQ